MANSNINNKIRNFNGQFKDQAPLQVETVMLLVVDRN